MRIRNGKAVEVHTYPDAAGLMMQLGLLGLAYVFSDARYRARVLGVFKLSSQKET